jgi:uncharacterized membrane protein YeaQ/YmgE (transglycosylase-associated protein family)
VISAVTFWNSSQESQNLSLSFFLFTERSLEMGILTWIFIGLIVGFLASSISKSHGSRKLKMLLVSLIGALVGWLNVAYLYRVPGAVYDWNWIVALAALAGALLAVLLFGVLKPQKSPAV